MSGPLRHELEERVGAPLSDMRLHRGAEAQSAAESARADAVTFGRSVFLGKRALDPTSPATFDLLAHEAAHVAQAPGVEAGATPAGIADRDDPLEQEAAAVGEQRQVGVTVGAVDRPVVFRGTERAEQGDGVADAATLIAQSHPHLSGLLTPQQIETFQRILDNRHHNRGVTERIARMEAAHQEQHGSVAAVVSAPHIDRAARGYRRDLEFMKYRLVEVDATRLLSPTIVAPQPWNQAAEAAFRQALWEEMAAKPVRLYMREGLAPAPFFTISWGDGEEALSLPADRRATFDDLLKVDRIWSRHRELVFNGPAYQEMDALHDRIQNDMYSDRDRHMFASEVRTDHWIRARIAETFSGAEMPGWDIWSPTETTLDAAFQAVLERKIELAGLLLIQAETLRHEARRQVIEYENETQAGAAAAVAALEVVKIAGAVAATIASGGLAASGTGLAGLSVASAKGAAVYGVVQETAQQTSEWGFGLRPGLDLGAIGKRGAVDGLTAYVGTLLGGAIASKLERALGPALTRFGIGPGWQRVIVDIVGAAGSAPATTAVQVVANRVVQGQWPQSADELKNMLVDEILIGGALQIGLGMARGRYRGPSPSSGGQPLLQDPALAATEPDIGRAATEPDVARAATEPDIARAATEPDIGRAATEPDVARAATEPALRHTGGTLPGMGFPGRGLGGAAPGQAAGPSRRVPLQPNELGSKAHLSTIDAGMYPSLVRDPNFMSRPENAAGWKGWSFEVTWKDWSYDIKWLEAGGTRGNPPPWGFVDALNKKVVMYAGSSR